MKKTFLVLALVFIAVSTIYAQPNKDEINYIQSTWGMEKRDIVKKHMDLSDEESKEFWEVYEKYEVSRKTLGEERIKTIADYANNVVEITDEKAEELVLKMLSNQTKLLELESTTYYQMREVISPIKATQFIQLENYLDTVLRMKIMEQLPLVGEINLK
jgi:Spy/CpxP family protein refolding chaperone